MKIHLVTAFPQLFRGPLDESIVRKAREKKIVDIYIYDLRDFTTDKHRQVDDYPYGGGPGMLLKPEPFFRAVDKIRETSQDSNIEILLTSPQGRLFNQRMAKELSLKDEFVILCGHYKGVDDRVRENLATDEVSIGDYVLTGGELAALVVLDAVVRLVPGVIGDINSALSDSFEDGMLDCGYYTRPETYREMKVPEVLLSGNHAEIEKWRYQEALRRTREKRQDLYEKLEN
jgi:tRNA (guanine37-N1)-methyltransferase